MSAPEIRTELPEGGGACTLGIHLDIDCLRGVEVVRGRIAQWFRIPYPAGLHPSSQEFPAFLKARLADYYSVLRHTITWVVGPTPSLQVRFLSLPKVRPSQMPNLVYWTFRKEIPFDAAQTVFDFSAEGGEASSSGPSRKMDATAYTVAQSDVGALTELFGHAGIHLDGILIPSFAMRNLFRAHPPAGSAMGLYVGEDSSAIMFFKGKQVVSHRLFKTGLNIVLDMWKAQHPEWSLAQIVQEIRSTLEPGPSAETEPGPFAAGDAERKRETIRAAFGRLTQQVERSLSAYMVGKEEAIKDIYVAGPMAELTPLVQELGRQLGLSSRPLDLFRPPGGGDNKRVPWEPEEAGAMSIALGAALSEKSQTPNLTYTYVKRMKEASNARVKRMLIGAGLIGVVLMLGGGYVVRLANEETRGKLEACMGQIQQISPAADRAMIQRLSDRAAANSAQMKAMALRSLPVAVLNQLALLTPEEIRLVSAVLEPGDVGAAKKSATRKAHASASDHPAMCLRVEGMVFGELGAQESKLASYQLRIEDSPLFESVVLRRSESGAEGVDPVLLFALEMQVEDLAFLPAAPPRTPEKGAVP